MDEANILYLAFVWGDYGGGCVPRPQVPDSKNVLTDFSREESVTPSDQITR